MFSVSGVTSAKIGLAPWYTTQFAVAQKVNGVVIASSPGPSPAAADGGDDDASNLLPQQDGGDPTFVARV